MVTQRVNAWLCEDLARRTVGPPTFSNNDGYTADTEAKETSHRPRWQALIS